MRQLIFVAMLCACVSTTTLAQQTNEQRFSELLGNVSVRPVAAAGQINVPFITWGADVAAFHANGGTKQTSPNSIYGRDGLKLAFYDGNDFVSQVRDYLSGKTPFLRGTMRMLGQASEVVGKDPRTKPVVIAQLSWSKGDHIVARDHVKRLDDLKGKRIACQQGGPHVGLLFDTLQSVQLSKSDVEIVWVKELTGPGGPADIFGKDRTVDACCVITPDMFGLTGGAVETGNGFEGTVKGAFVLNSTQQMTGSIADVYAVRSDWLQENRETAKKFVAGFLRGTEEVRQQRNQYESNPKQRMSSPYRKTLLLSQSTFGKDTIPTLEEDAHGLLLDCEFSRLTGQIDFFEGIYDANGRLRTNPIGFAAKADAALLLAKEWGYAGTVARFDHAKWDYEMLAKAANLRYVRPKAPKDIAGEVLPKNIATDEKTIYSFEIHFDEDQRKFPVERYAPQFARAIDAVALYKNALVVIQGHSDSAGTLIALLNSGMKKKLITRNRSGKFQYIGQPLKPERMVDLIKTGKFSGGGIPPAKDPANVMQSALNLSRDRAAEVKKVIVELASDRKIALDAGRLRPDGAGITAPVIAVPNNPEQSQANRRVEFRVMRVEAERVESEDYNLLQGVGP